MHVSGSSFGQRLQLPISPLGPSHPALLAPHPARIGTNCGQGVAVRLSLIIFQHCWAQKRHWRWTCISLSVVFIWTPTYYPVSAHGINFTQEIIRGNKTQQNMGKLREVLEHPDELMPLIQMAYAAERAKVLPKDENLAFCYSMLNRVSRRCSLHTVMDSNFFLSDRC